MTDEQFDNWLGSEEKTLVTLVEVSPVHAGTGQTMPAYLSNRPYSGANPSGAVTQYQPAVVGGLDFTGDIPLDGSASISYGDIEVENLSGEFDHWLSLIWGMTPVRVLIGDLSWQPQHFRAVFTGVVGSLESRSRDTLNLTLFDNLQKANTPISEAKIGGTLSNKDELLPVTLGECFNVEPVLVNPASLEYAVNPRGVQSILSVRDNGVPVGFYDTGYGRFKLSASPAGQITASVVGDAGGAGVQGGLPTVVATTYQRPTVSFSSRVTQTFSYGSWFDPFLSPPTSLNFRLQDGTTLSALAPTGQWWVDEVGDLTMDRGFTATATVTAVWDSWGAGGKVIGFRVIEASTGVACSYSSNAITVTLPPSRLPTKVGANLVSYVKVYAQLSDGSYSHVSRIDLTASRGQDGEVTVTPSGSGSFQDGLLRFVWGPVTEILTPTKREWMRKYLEALKTLALDAPDKFTDFTYSLGDTNLTIVATVPSYAHSSGTRLWAAYPNQWSLRDNDTHQATLVSGAVEIEATYSTVVGSNMIAPNTLAAGLAVQLEVGGSTWDITVAEGRTSKAQVLADLLDAAPAHLKALGSVTVGGLQFQVEHTRTMSVPAGTYLLNQPVPAEVIGQVSPTAARVFRRRLDSFPDKAGSLARLLLGDYGSAYSKFQPSDFDDQTFIQLDVSKPYVVGTYMKDRKNLLATCQEVLASVSAHLVCHSTGKLRVVRLFDDGPPTTTLTTSDIVSNTLEVFEVPPVQTTVNLDYNRNWTVQSSGLATSLSAEATALLGKEWLTATASASQTVVALHKRTEEPKHQETALARRVDAEAEALHRLQFWSVQRKVIRAEFLHRALMVELGDRVSIQHPRFGLSAGAVGTVVHVSRNWVQGTVTLGVLI